MNSIKKNFFFSTFLTISNYVFPLITYPYVSRVLQVERIGLCNFVDSIINYFILFSMLGISTYGIREIAKNKSDKTKLNQTFYDLISINILMSILLCFILFISLNYSETLSQNKQLVYIGICKLLLNTFLVEWFYKVTTKKRNAERYSDRIELQGFQSCFRLFVKPSQSPLKPNQDAATLLVRNHARNGDKRTRITKQGVKD